MEGSTIAIIIGASIAVLIILLLTLRNNAISTAIATARKDNTVDPIVEAISKDQNKDSASLYNSAIKTLWDSFDRELAIDLAKVFLEKKACEPIAQYWLQQIQTVEPELARTKMGEEFIKSHYVDEAAKACAGGCCGSCG